MHHSRSALGEPRPLKALLHEHAVLEQLRALPPDEVAKTGQPKTSGPNGASMTHSRPAFNAAWAASMRIYDAADPSGNVATIVGGKVAQNINRPGGWENTCAVRMSYILNQCGLHIPPLTHHTVRGADGSSYFFRVKDLIKFLKQEWGDPDVVDQYPPSGGGALIGKKGVVLFEVAGWADASGHATLWNGALCYDHCYFNEPTANYTTKRANFWALSSIGRELFG